MKQFHSNIHRKIFSSLIVKFGVCFLLLGVAYRLFSSSFVQFSPVGVSEDESEFTVAKVLPPPPQAAEPAQTADDLFVNLEKYPSQDESCNLFIGDWIRDPNGPVYTNSTCPLIESPQNCMKNGRPDSDYVYWRWKPKDCKLPKLDPKKFLNIMRRKSLAFIGDSIMRNHVQSLLCILSQVEQPVEVYHDKSFKNRRWSFPSQHFTVSVVWAPYLTKAVTFEDDDGVSTGITQLHVDEPDPIWTDQYQDFDYVIIAGGKWFLKSAIYYENNSVIGCHNCNNENITEIGFERAYQKALNATLRYISQSEHKPFLFFRTTTPDHFENGEWNTGGYCNRTRPFKDGEIDIGNMDEIMRKVEIEEFKGVKERILGKDGVNLKLFDTTRLLLLRPDGHPGVYRQFHPYDGKDENAKIQNDCLHWCLPGPIDSWNDLMMEMLVRSTR